MLSRGPLSRLLVIQLVLLLSACAADRSGSFANEVKDFRAPDAPKIASADEIYKLAPLDSVTVTVFQVAELSGDYSVDQSGHLTMPLVGLVQAVGLTTNELGNLITQRLNEKYLRNPNVTVTLKESLGRVVTVDGSVREPGVFPATKASSLIQAVAIARGVDEFANPHRVAIIREIDGKRMGAAFDLTRIRRGLEKDPAVYAGDTIIVDGSRIKKARKELLQTLPLAAIFFLI